MLPLGGCKKCITQELILSKLELVQDQFVPLNGSWNWRPQISAIMEVKRALKNKR